MTGQNREAVNPAPSARGLFRATGKKAKARPMLLPDGSYIKTDEPPRRSNDAYFTEPEPTLSLLYYEREVIAKFPLIWEPACGDGGMTSIMKSCGVNVIGSDLVDRGTGAVIQDFFAFREPLAPAIVTNPPFDKVNWRDGRGQWIWHAMDMLRIDYMALLLNWSWPGAGGMARLWETHKPARVYLMRWKIDFTGEGAPPMYNGWFIWERGNREDPKLLMMDRADPRQSSLLPMCEVA